MSRIYQSADQLTGGTPLLELTRIERQEGLEAHARSARIRGEGGTK